MRIAIAFLILIITTSSKCSNSQESGEKSPRQDEINWLSVKSWSAKYQESYRSQKQWESTPGLQMSSTYESTVSGTYTLDVTEGDGEFYGEWYGYGSGSLYSVQIVKMESQGPNGKIVITEKTETRGSGAIGDPKLNEYGEFWGGSLSIDLYSGTYSVGFGGPESNSKSTLTRTVEGIPTDYSELSQLPNGLRQIFVPLGEKAEEWATYNGPLEDAEGVMVAGMFGMDMMPDFDEPTEYELPKNGTVLTGSYTGKSTTKSWTVYPSGMEMPEVFVEIIDKDWIPEEDNTVEVKLSWENLNPSEVEFTLFDISEEPGICLNSEDDNTDPDMDITEDDQSNAFEIEKKNKQIIALDRTSTHDKKEAIIVIRSLDYGAHALIKARIKAADVWYDAEVKDLGGNALHLPFDENENHIADKWEKDVNIFNKNYTADWDEDLYPRDQLTNGDGLTLYEEYRGFMAESHVLYNPDNVLIDGSYFRMDPNHKDIFIYDPDNLFKKYYANENPSFLNWHYVDKTTMLFKSDPTDTEHRWINFNTTKTYFFRNQYAMHLVMYEDSGQQGIARHLGTVYLKNDSINGTNTFRNSECQDANPKHPLRCRYLIEVSFWGIQNYVRQHNPSDGDVLIPKLLASTVQHEVGHGLGIGEHVNIKTGEFESSSPYTGSLYCVMRYDKMEDIMHPTVVSMDRYCNTGDTWTEIDVAKARDPNYEGPIKYNTYPSHNCFGKINVKGF